MKDRALDPSLASVPEQLLIRDPLGDEGVMPWGGFFLLVSPRSAERPIVKQFAAWLRTEIQDDARPCSPR